MSNNGHRIFCPAQNLIFFWAQAMLGNPTSFRSLAKLLLVSLYNSSNESNHYFKILKIGFFIFWVMSGPGERKLTFVHQVTSDSDSAILQIKSFWIILLAASKLVAYNWNSSIPFHLKKLEGKLHGKTFSMENISCLNHVSNHNISNELIYVHIY